MNEINIDKMNAKLDLKRHKSALLVAANAALDELPVVGELKPLGCTVDDELSVKWKYGLPATDTDAESCVVITVTFEAVELDKHTRGSLQQECTDLFTEHLQTFMASGILAAQLAAEDRKNGG